MNNRVVVSLIALAAVVSMARVGRAEPETSGMLDAKGVKIHYVVQGKGEAVILIHGLMSSIDINWKMPGVLQALAADHMVVALDLPGHGKSDKPADPDAYGVQIIDDIVMLMDHLQIKKAHLVGYSLGGAISMKFMTMHGDRVLSCVMGGFGLLREGSFLQGVWEKMTLGDKSKPTAGRVRGFGQLAVTEQQVREIRVPVIVVVGDHDPVKRMYVEPLQGVRKDWPVVTVADAGHLNCIIKPEFKAQIVKWVGEHTGK